MKRSASLLALLLAILLIPLPHAAATTDVTDAISSVSGLSPLEEALYRGMMATEEKIDISSFNATAEEIVGAMQHLSDSVPELFHVERTYKYNTKAVTPTYLYTGAALEAARAEYLLALDLIAAGVDPAWSDAMICLYLHDYLCKAFAYDTDYEIFDAYRFLIEGRGVCQSYTLVYAALLSRFGIPVTYATGKDNGTPHIWSIVMLDGEYYHVDVTWGDALSGGGDCFGRATHDNFLKSDAAIDRTGHANRENYGGIVCDSTLYDGGVLSAIQAPTAILGGVVYAIENGRVLAFEDGLAADPTVVYTVTEKWQSGLGVLREKPAGIAAYGDTLYVNTPKSILALDPASGHTEPFLTIEHGLIMTIFNTDDRLSYSVADSIRDETPTVLSATLPPALPPCTTEHVYEIYATKKTSCAEAGTHYKKCTACGHKTTEEIAALPHTEVATVVPPAYGVGGYTAITCTACGAYREVMPTDPLPLPTLAEYRAAVFRVTNAATAAAKCEAIAEALRMEPHLEGVEALDEYAALHEAIAAYDADAAAANAAHAEEATLLFFADFSFFTGAGTAMLLLFLAIRRIMGL